MRTHLIGILVVAFSLHCNNVGFVDKAKAAANGEFGFLVFALGGNGFPGNILQLADTSFYTSCAGFSGISKGNCICQQEASSRSSAGTFKAWLSIAGSVDAICNIQGIEGTGCSVSSGLGPFLANSASGYSVIAQDYTELSTTGFRFGISAISKVNYSGTNADGRASGSDCSGFTATGGSAATSGDHASAGISFTTGSTASCNAGVGSFLCMRQSK